MDDCTYIKVILPLRLDWEPCYRTSEKDVRCGMRVTVPFAGRNYLAVVSGTELAPDVDPARIKDVRKVERHLDDITQEEMKLWKFISEYYLCTIGEVYKLAYPSIKNAGEQVTARAEERHEIMKEKSLDLYRKRLARLEERLEKKNAALAGRHGSKVMSALEEDKQKIINEIDAVKSTIEAMSGDDIAAASCGSESSPAVVACPTHDKTSDDILSAFSQGRNVLLEGGSARIEAVIAAAAATLSSGKDVLMLVPDIALSRQLQARLEEVFGASLMVFHSAESAGRRREVASVLRHSSGPRFILGTRSALFLPFRHLGLIIVEEEHDPAYKQDGAPKYVARDTAVMLGEIHGANVLLASPTPSLESLFNCISGRYVHIKTEKEDGLMEIVDTSEEKKKGGMVGNLSRILIRQVKECCEAGGKVLIVRPWGPLDDLEEEVFAVLPELRDSSLICFRTVFEARREDIEGYSLLAMTGTDLMLDKSDFRADERVMQTLEQFRARFKGSMLIQTRQGGHPVFTHDSRYTGMLLAERKAFNYPPYSRILDIVMHDHNEARLKKLSASLAAGMNDFNPVGPFAPMKGKAPESDVAVIRIMLAKDKHLVSKKKKIAGIVSDFEKSCKYSGHISIDVDPV